MTGRKIRCTIVEVANDPPGARGPAGPLHRELPLWADPFIARLVEKHRIRAALADSLRFLESEAAHQLDRIDAAEPAANPPPAGRWPARFRLPDGGDPFSPG